MNNRYEICKQCNDFNMILKLCKVCGCFMPVKTKIKNESCPKGLWNEDN